MIASAFSIAGPDLIVVAIIAVLLAAPVGLGVLIFLLLRRKERRDAAKSGPKRRRFEFTDRVRASLGQYALAPNQNRYRMARGRAGRSATADPCASP